MYRFGGLKKYQEYSVRIMEKCCIAKGDNLVICFNKLFFVMMLSDVCFNFAKQIFHFLIKGKCISTRQITQLEYKDMELLGFPISFVAKRLTLIPSKLVIICRYENYQQNISHEIIFCTQVRFDVGLITRLDSIPLHKSSKLLTIQVYEMY